MELRTRAYRRDRLERKKRRVLDYYGGWMKQADAAYRARYVGKNAGTPHPCSCPMCGNPRRHFGERTVQERRMEVQL